MTWAKSSSDMNSAPSTVDRPRVKTLVLLSCPSCCLWGPWCQHPHLLLVTFLNTPAWTVYSLTSRPVRAVAALLPSHEPPWCLVSRGVAHTRYLYVTACTDPQRWWPCSPSLAWSQVLKTVNMKEQQQSITLVIGLGGENPQPQQQVTPFHVSLGFPSCML